MELDDITKMRLAKEAGLSFTEKVDGELEFLGTSREWLAYMQACEDFINNEELL